MPKNWCFRTVVLEKTLESLVDIREIKPVNPKGNQPWIFTGRTDAESEASILWPLDVKSQLIGLDPVAWKDWRQEEKGMTKNGMFRWHHQFNGLEFEQTVGVSEGQGSLVCCSHGETKNQIQLSDWAATYVYFTTVKFFNVIWLRIAF